MEIRQDLTLYAFASMKARAAASETEGRFLAQIQRHQGIIGKVIRLYIDHPEEQKDLTQEIVLQAWRSYQRFEGQSRFSTWLYRVALNTVLTYRRNQSRRPNPSQGTDQLQIAEKNPERSAQSDLLWRAIRQLKEVERMIIVLHLEGYAHEEIAQISGMSKNNVTVKLHRIKHKLTATLNPVLKSSKS